MIVKQEVLHEIPEPASPSREITSNSPSIFSEMSDEKEMCEEVRMSRLDENIQNKEIVPQFPSKPCTTDDDFGSPKGKRVPVVSQSMAFTIGSSQHNMLSC